MLHVNLEGLRVGGSLYTHRPSHGSSFEGDGGHQGSVFAPVPRNLGVGPLSLRSPSSQAPHGDVKARLLHEHEAPSVEMGSQPSPQASGFFVALGGYP